MGGHTIKEAEPFNYEEGLAVFAFVIDFFRDKLGSTWNSSEKVSHIGSWVNKRGNVLYGDMDFAVEIPAKATPESFYEYFKMTCGRSFEGLPEPVFNKGLSIISIPVKVGEKICQVDLILTKNLQFSEWIHGISHESQYNATQRNVLLMAMVYCQSYKPIEMYYHPQLGEIPITWERDFIDINHGLLHGIQTVKGIKKPVLKVRKIVEKHLISDIPVEIIGYIFGDGIAAKNVYLTFEKLFQFCERHKCRNWIFETTLRNMKRLNIEIPKELT